jgi:hypothetical protein
VESSDELVLSGGGSVAVATDALFAAVAELRRFAGHADGVATRVALLSLHDGERCVGPTAGNDDLPRAALALRTAAASADELALALQRGAENYGELERRALRMWRSVEGLAAERAGFWLSLLLPLLPAMSASVAGVLLGALLSPGGLAEAGRSTAAAFQPLSGVLTSPFTAALLRSLTLAGDDFAGGALRLPPGTAALFGERGLDLVGLPGTAALLVALGTRFGAVREGDVRVRVSRRTSVPAAPAGFRDRVDRVPTGPSQIRIERYTFSSGADRFEVFLGGTRAAGILGGDEPWDMTSNLHAVGDLSPGSLRAAEEAMRQAGVTPESEVVFTGYSQGGLLATRLASSAEWNTQGLVTFGAPVAGIELPDGFPAVQLEHTDDLVPAFGGDRRDLTPIVVRREAFAGREVPVDVAVPAHRLAEYRSTAELLDAARAPAVAQAAGRLRTFGRGAEHIEVTLYRADRVPER